MEEPLDECDETGQGDGEIVGGEPSVVEQEVGNRSTV